MKIINLAYKHSFSSFAFQTKFNFRQRINVTILYIQKFNIFKNLYKQRISWIYTIGENTTIDNKRLIKNTFIFQKERTAHYVNVKN